MIDPIDKKIEELLLDGVLEVAGMDLESGEPLYNFTNKLKDYNEELYKIHNNYFFKDLTSLWEKGFININFLEDDPTVTLTDKASSETEIDRLDKEEKQSLNEIKRITGE
jgi:hypothetical protein